MRHRGGRRREVIGMYVLYVKGYSKEENKFFDRDLLFWIPFSKIISSCMGGHKIRW